MRVKFIHTAFVACLALGAMLAASPVLSKDAPGPTVSKAVAKPLIEAQKAMKENDLTSALVHVHEAQAVPDRTPYDDFSINEFLANIAIGQKDFATAAAAYEAMADSPELTADKKAATLGNAMLLAYNVKHYANVVRYGEALEAMGPLDSKYAGPLAATYFQNGEPAKAMAVAQKVIDAAKAAGKVPEEGVLDIVVHAQLKENDYAAATATLEMLAQNYGSPGDWGTLMELSFTTKGMHEPDALNLYRLGIAADATIPASDYALMADVAARLGYPGEEVAMLEHGLAKGTITAQDKAGTMLSAARQKEAEDKRTLPAFAKEAAARKTGDYDIKLAETYYGYGRYAEAEEAARRADSKGGTKDPVEAQLVIGMALARQGKNAEAADVLNRIGGNTPSVKVAHLWALYAQRKYGITAAAQ